MSSNYQLTVMGCNNLQRGVYKGAVSGGIIELLFKQGDAIVRRVSLSADRTSLSRSLQMTREKVDLICQRLGVSESQLDYDRSDLSGKEKLVTKLLFLKKMLFEAFIPTQWVIVYKKENEAKWQRIIPDSSVFQADTFVVFKDNKYTIFYEELQFADYHGYLMAAELDIENNRLINEKIILKLDYHLSYPSVFEEAGKFYMIPESADGHTVDLYECTDFPYQWQKKQTLLADIDAVDTTVLKRDGAWYLFTTEIVKGADCNDELSVYKSSDLFDEPFTKLYDEPIVSDITNARMGGNFIERDGELFRVAQNCGKRYGHQANINKVIQIEGGYKEEIVETLKPERALGFHSYNQDHDLLVGDMEVARFDFYSLKRFVWGNIKQVVFNR